MAIKVSQYIHASRVRNTDDALPPWYVLLPMALALAGCVVYANMLSNPLVLRDVDEIVHNERLRELGTSFYGHRPITNFTFGLNYGFGALGAFGYHAFNLLIHLLAGLTLFGVVRRTLNTSLLREHYGPGSIWIAFTAALLWMIHPLQTEVVSYTVNRADTLMALFYLLTMYCMIRGATIERGYAWYLAAMVTCGLGMGSKGAMVTAPIAMMLFDRVYLARSMSELFRQRGWVYAGLLATWLVLISSGLIGDILPTHGKLVGAGSGAAGITPLEYAMTQPGVILQYLKLSVWPQSLCVDYLWHPVRSFFGAGAVPILIVAGLVLWTVVTLVRRPVLGFMAAWFFLTLAPTSSLVPHADLLAEHRMYLPLAAVVVMAVLAGHAVLTEVLHRNAVARRSLAIVLIMLITPALAYGTMARNRDYRDNMTMWTDVAKKRPNNYRGPLGIGRAYKTRGEYVLAEAALRRAVQLGEDAEAPHFYLGDLLFEQNRHREAFDELYRANELGREDVAVYMRMGKVSKVLGRYDAAVLFYDKALTVQPGDAEAFCQRGDALTLDDRAEESLESYHRAMAAAPDYFDAYQGISISLSQLSRFEEALKYCDEALRIRPDSEGAKVQRSLILQKMGEQKTPQ